MALGDKLSQDYEQRLRDISAGFQVVNPEVIQNALSQGGSVSGSLGFNSPFDVLGLTPEQFDQILENRSRILNDNLKQVAGAINLKDQLYGISEARQTARQSARDMYVQGNETQRFEAGQAGENQRLAFSQGEENKRHAQNIELGKSQLAETVRANNLQHEATMAATRATEQYRQAEIAYQRASLAQQGQIALMNNARQREEFGARLDELRLRRDELKQQREIALDQKKQVFLTTTNEKLDQQLINLAAQRKKNDTPALQSLSYKLTLQKEALNREPGIIFDANEFKKFNGGWPQMRLGPDHNWYGYNPQETNPQKQYSSAPLVMHPVPNMLER